MIINVIICYLRFDFVRSVGTAILPISLPNGQEISGRVIKHITGNGPIYLRALKALKVSHQMVSFSIFSITCKQHWVYYYHWSDFPSTNL